MAVSNAVQKPDELIQLVDRQGNDVGTARRGQMRAENLLHRASAVLVFNIKGEIFVQKRVAFKETFPSFFDPAPGGVCGAHETVAENAAAELAEEMGIQGVELLHLFNYFHVSEGLQYWGSLFSCVYDGPMRLQPEEVESGQFMSVQELKQLLEDGPVCPDSKQAVLEYFYREEAGLLPQLQ